MNKIHNAKIQWGDDGLPFSATFQDKYFCQENGAQESDFVFCQGNSLEKRWQQLSVEQTGVFTIGELGFGSGLNFISAWKMWKKNAPPNWQLHFISIEQFPLTHEDFVQSAKLWPELESLTQNFLPLYPTQFNPIQKIVVEDAVALFLLCAPVREALVAWRQEEQLDSKVDAWFLDGFAPQKNPDMWSEDVFALMNQLSMPGTTLATFTVAGNVYRGLQQQGFEVEKVKGFGRKRHMLRGMKK